MLQRMNDIESFIKLVDGVCLRADMYTLNGTFAEVAALFTGMTLARVGSPIAGDEGRALDRFVAARLCVPDKYHWAGAIDMVAEDDERAIRKLRDLLVEFAELRKTRSFDEILLLAARIRQEHVESEPARVWGRFLAAYYNADRALIEPLILDHPNAWVLWRGDGTPPGVAKQLMEISASHAVSVVAGAREMGRVSLATDVGVVEAYLINGSWRIDASPWIEMALARRTTQ